MATGIYSWSQTAASNSNADSTINWAEGQAPSSVNDSSRAAMAILARWRDDISGVAPSNTVLTTGGSANAQTLTTNESIGTLTNGWTVTFKAGASNTSTCTLNVDSKGAKAVQLTSGSGLVAGEIVSGRVYTVTYHQPADAWLIHTAPGTIIPSTTAMLFVQTSAPTGWTKGATHNNKALRVVTGTASTGGSTAFTSVFTSRTVAQANLPSVNWSHSLTAATHTHSVTGTYSGVTGTEDPAHQHTYSGTTSSDGSHTHNYTDRGDGDTAATAGGVSVADSGSDTYTTGSGGTHTHTYSGTTGSENALHAHLCSGSISGTAAASGALTVSGTVSSGGSGTALDFAVQYVDVIIATKD
jgi:hypothetical protein